MLNYFNFGQFKDKYLITNDLGRYSFISKETFNKLCEDDIKEGDECWRELIDKQFIFGESLPAVLNDTVYTMRESKNYVFSPTSLHIFVVTNACNLGCVYCQAGSSGATLFDYMSFETAEKAVDMAMSSPNRYLSFEFQGGEPLLNFKTIKHIVEYSESVNTRHVIQYSIVTNLTCLTDEIIEFCAEHFIVISTSLDGSEVVHNSNRPYVSGEGTFNTVKESIARLRAAGVNVGAIQTTTKKSLDYPKEIVDSYVELGLNSIFVRPLTPLGYAKRNWDSIGYTPEEFIEFYSKCLEHIIECNKNGSFIQEGHASIFLEKILYSYPVNYMELRSPCGAVTGQLAYYTNGDVFTCDEARMIYEMGNDSFKAGNVYNDDFNSIINSSVCKTVCTASVTESIPGCCDCVYQPYCGVCPVINLALYKDIIPKYPNSYKCKIYKGMLNAVFTYLYENNPSVMEVLRSWRS